MSGHAGKQKLLQSKVMFAFTYCTADVLPSTVASHSYIVLLSVGGVTVAQEVCSSVV